MTEKTSTPQQIEAVLRKKTIECNLTKLEKLYSKEQNPLFAWEAVKLCVELSVKFPPWTMDYLHSCADAILSIEKAGKTLPIKIAKATRLSKDKGGSWYKQAKRDRGIEGIKTHAKVLENRAPEKATGFEMLDNAVRSGKISPQRKQQWKQFEKTLSTPLSQREIKDILTSTHNNISDRTLDAEKIKIRKKPSNKT